MKGILIIIILTGCTSGLYEVNKAINSYAYLPDKTDYMKTEAEFIKDGGGDCEDFANAKYQELLKEGVPSNEMKFVLIPMEEITGKPHAVLEVRGLILDNMNNSLTPANLVAGYRVNQAQMRIIARGHS